MKATRIGRGSRIGLAVVVGLGLAAGVGGVLQVRAVSPSSQDLCLQGDVTNPNSGQTGAPTTACAAGQFDWTDFFNSSGGSKTLPTGTFGTFTDSNFQPDAALPDKTTFATGSKDTVQISGGSSNWQCSSANNLGAKVDLANTYATIERLSGVGGHTIFYYGSEIQSANGDHNQGMWLLQDPNVGCTAGTGNTNFSGSHVNGDLLFAVELTGGGSKPFSASTVGFKWSCTNDPITKVCPTSSPGSLVALNGGNSLGGICSPTSTTNACAITNQTWNVVTPWAPHNSGTTALGPQQFFEGGIDITAVEAAIGGSTFCSSRFLTDTRSSQSATATLFDYTQGSLNTCAAPTLATALKNASDGSAVSNTGVTIGSQVYDTATLSGTIGTPGGTVDYNLYPTCTNNSSGIGVGSGTFTTSPATYESGANSGSPFTANPVSHVALSSGSIPNSDTLEFTQTGTFYFTASYSGDGINLATSSPCEPIIINAAPTTLATTASNGTNPIVVGTTNNSISDSAAISGAFGTPGGTITFTLNGPATGTSCGALITTIGPVSVTSATTSSGAYLFSPTSVGTYYWSAVWTGDDNNTGSSHAGCAVVNGATVVDSSEAVPVVPATPTLSTTMALTDTVTVSGGDNPTGSVTFSLFVGATCSGGQVGASETVALVTGTATTPNAISIPTDGTIYSWKVQYLGNANNNTVIDGCTLASHEQVTTSYAGQ